MSAICTCKDAIIVTTPGQKDPHCERCGYWWIPKYGSTEPVDHFASTSKERGDSLEAAKEIFSRGKRVPKIKSHWMLKRNKLGG